MCVYVCVCVLSVGKTETPITLVRFILLLQKSFALGIFDLWQQILQHIEVRRNKKERVNEMWQNHVLHLYYS